jgi:hypothetical protein
MNPEEAELWQTEPEVLDVNAFLGYLQYRYCVEETRFPRDEAFIRNTKNEAVSNVPLRYANISREMMYMVCWELGINMPEEFSYFQRWWGDRTNPQLRNGPK